LISATATLAASSGGRAPSVPTGARAWSQITAQGPADERLMQIADNLSRALAIWSSGPAPKRRASSARFDGFEQLAAALTGQRVTVGQ
jgi:hypothetical protein